tara:strand:- start:418 stop:720 length:303 start_codon:yes stop_codon:yes gene_type:complete
MKSENTKYILKDSFNTYISIHDTEKEIFDKLNEFSEKFKDTYSVFGGDYNYETGESKPIYEDNAVFKIPEELKREYRNEEYITFYFFKFDTKTNKRISIY